MQETYEIQAQSLGREEPLEEGIATHSSTLAWRIPVDGEAWWAAVHGVAKSQTPLKQLGMHAHNSNLRPVLSAKQVLVQALMNE